MNNKEKALFCEQLAMVLDAGISFSEGIAILPKGLENLNKELEAGLPLAKALENCGIEDDYLLSLIKVGEESGYLSESLKQLSVYYGRMSEVNEKLKEAMAYPMVLIAMMTVIVAVLIYKVLPLFERVLNNIGVGISPLAKILMSSGRYLAIVGLIILVLVILIGIYIYSSFAGRNDIIGGLSSLPLVSKVGKKLSLAKFAFELSLFLNSGYDVDSALKLCEESCHNQEIKEKINQLSRLSNDGESLAEGFLKVKVFAGVYDQLLAIGFKTGKSVEAMSKVASEYEKEADHDINHYLDVIEPIIVGILCLVVGAILLSVMLPLMSIMSSL